MPPSPGRSQASESESTVSQILVAIAAVVVAVLGGSVAVWRFSRLRKRGLPLAIRSLPGSADGLDWRHAVVILTDQRALVYRLRSLRPGCDDSFARQSVHVESRRELTPGESPLFENNEHVLRLEQEDGNGWEIAVTDSGDTAIVAWIESAPSVMHRRRLPTDMERRYRHVRERSRRER